MKSNTDALPWYSGISQYQWLVLLIASLGWVFDIFEGQIYIANMSEVMPTLLKAPPGSDAVNQWNNYALASFLLGGAFGGVLFGVMSDKIGRSTTMIVTILFYSVFTCLSAFATAAWMMVALRFLVAMGVGGEWAVASALVAEVMPKRSRAVMSSIFHGSSVFGTLLAAGAGFLLSTVAAQQAYEYFLDSTNGAGPLGDGIWRISFLVGALPALLTIIIRWRMKEPEAWKRAQQVAATDRTQATGSIVDLMKPAHLRNTLVGVGLATVGLVTFWGCHVYGKNALKRVTESRVLKAATDDPASLSPEQRREILANSSAQIKQAEMASMVLNTLGGGLGLVLFGAISNRLGRRGAFVFYHVGGLIASLFLFQVLLKNDPSFWTLAIFLPIFGFLTLGMHAGYAVYFPELFPTRLRGAGAGFCFNMGRLGSALAIYLAAVWKWPQDATASYTALLFALGVVVTLLARETRDEELPE